MKTFCVMLLGLVLGGAQLRVPVAASATVEPQISHRCCPPSEAIHCSARCCVTSAPGPVESQHPASVPVSTRTSLAVPALINACWELPLPMAQSRLELAESLAPCEILAVPPFPSARRHPHLS